MKDFIKIYHKSKVNLAPILTKICDLLAKRIEAANHWPCINLTDFRNSNMGLFHLHLNTSSTSPMITL